MAKTKIKIGNVEIELLEDIPEYYCNIAKITNSLLSKM